MDKYDERRSRLIVYTRAGPTASVEILIFQHQEGFHTMRRIMGTRFRYLAVLVGVLVFGVGIAATPASAAPSSRATTTDNPLTASLTVSADGWITYNDTWAPSLGLIDPETTTVSGTGVGLGCSFSHSGHVARGGAGTYQEEVAYNPATCQEKVITGTLTAAATKKLNTLSGGQATAGTTPSSATRSAATPAVQGPYAYSSTSAYEKSAWIDPIDITITSFADDLTWTYDGTYWGTANALAQSYEFAYDGWSNTGIPPINWTTSTPYAIGFNEHEQFTNTDFEEALIIAGGLAAPPWGAAAVFAACGFSIAPAVFDLTDGLTGRGDGGYNWSYNDNAAGGCSNLVHHANWNGFGFLT